MPKFLVIQTAFIGDAILGTALLERLHQEHPKSQIDYLVRKGNESLFNDHPFLNELLIWDKNSKYSDLIRLISKIRKAGYTAVYNIQRYANSGLLTGLSGAKHRIGYNNNPLSFLFSKSVKHRFGAGYETVHEVDRVADLLGELSTGRTLPKVYPAAAHHAAVEEFVNDPFITVAPASVWFTKQFPAEKWIEFIDRVPSELKVILIGGPSDKAISEAIGSHASRSTLDLTGKLNLLQTAALMKSAKMNFANDSAPVHLASATNAPICEVYCSTVPSFGFHPLSENSHVVEVQEKLSCRPCGIHGKKACPKGHFKCALDIDVESMLAAIPS